MSALYVRFAVGDAEYVVSADAVEMLETWAGATPVPGTPPWVAGIVQVRGQVIPVVDLRARFGLPPSEPSLDERVVVVRRGGAAERSKARVIGLKVDRARSVVAVEEGAFEPPPDVVGRASMRWIDAVTRIGERLCLRMDVDRVVEGGTDG